MLKYDSCYHMGRIGTPQISFNRFKVMSDALKATGRNILLNLCNWGEDSVHTVRIPWTVRARLSSDVDTVGNVHLELVACYRRYLRQLHS
jgi:alpha-galactosidase